MKPVPDTMAAVLLTGHGGFDKLEYHNHVPVPVPAPDEVLIQVMACGINNTDINTRTGWYSKSVTAQTSEGAKNGIASLRDMEGSWTGSPLLFPLIQGADVCGRIVKAGKDIDPHRIGERVIVAAMQPHPSGNPWECITLGSEINGGFAQYVTVRSNTAHKVTSDWSDTELASMPCAGSTAENMLHRSKVTARDTVLITGGSGGVGSAAIQLAKKRGARVITIAEKSKIKQVLSLGADQVISRNEDLVKVLGHDTMDVICDLVAGPRWTQLLDVLKRGGRYVVSGAIAGPLVEMDIRTLYLKDLSFLGCTFQAPPVFENLISSIENNDIKPVVAKTYPLKEIIAAQTDFLAKTYTGKLVLIPPYGV